MYKCVFLTLYFIYLLDIPEISILAGLEEHLIIYKPLLVSRIPEWFGPMHCDLNVLLCTQIGLSCFSSSYVSLGLSRDSHFPTTYRLVPLFTLHTIVYIWDLWQWAACACGYSDWRVLSSALRNLVFPRSSSYPDFCQSGDPNMFLEVAIPGSPFKYMWCSLMCVSCITCFAIS